MRNTSATTGTRDIVCPFFVAHGATEIVCEAVIPGAKCACTRFKDEEKKKFHLKTYCEKRYDRCEKYISIMHWRWPEDE